MQNPLRATATPVISLAPPTGTSNTGWRAVAEHLVEFGEASVEGSIAARWLREWRPRRVFWLWAMGLSAAAGATNRAHDLARCIHGVVRDNPRPWGAARLIGYEKDND